ncbi:hypothetical protein POM88_033714 [Heracleum sosnowskyi]|uniref:Uncharacterized protein n=1 Tax=Heracleum sosnowskyi TaxID=360622 RepID=A0AAD8MCC5_9APIA|nr:hypothetical protein POM88_033714 [Heracleum sosnowskyi]
MIEAILFFDYKLHNQHGGGWAITCLMCSLEGLPMPFCKYHLPNIDVIFILEDENGDHAELNHCTVGYLENSSKCCTRQVSVYCDLLCKELCGSVDSSGERGHVKDISGVMNLVAEIHHINITKTVGQFPGTISEEVCATATDNGFFDMERSTLRCNQEDPQAVHVVEVHITVPVK